MTTDGGAGGAGAGIGGYAGGPDDGDGSRPNADDAPDTTSPPPGRAGADIERAPSATGEPPDQVGAGTDATSATSRPPSRTGADSAAINAAYRPQGQPGADTDCAPGPTGRPPGSAGADTQHVPGTARHAAGTVEAPGTAGGDPRALPFRPPAHQVDPKAVRWWQLRALPTFVLLLAAQVVGIALLPAGVATLLTVTAVVTLVAGVAYEIVVPRLLFRLHRWEVTDEAVYTLSGWIVREWRIAPISRVQTVDTEHGPLQQLLKLATVTVTTASARGPVKIAGLAADDARELARTLTETTQAHPGDAT